MVEIAALPFKDFRDAGLLWAINRYLFHPRGFAVAFTFDESSNVKGWDLLGAGKEVWTFDTETDDLGFERFEKFLKERETDNG